MSSGTYTKRDHVVSREIHRLFWRSTFEDTPSFIVWLLTRPAALVIYNVLIPFEIAYTLQAIITRQFGRANHYLILILLLGLAYCILWAIGGVAICRNGRIGTAYIQKEVFANFLEKDYEFFNNTYLGALAAQAMRVRDCFNDYCVILMNGVTKQFVAVTTSIGIIAYHSTSLAFITLASMAILVGFTLTSARWRVRFRRLLSEANSEVGGVLGDALGHGATVKSFASEAFERKRYAAAADRLAHTQYLSWMSSVPADIGRTTLATLAMFVLLLMTSRLYQHHSISIAIVVLVQLYVVRLIMSTQDIADLLKSYEATMSGAYEAVKTMMITPAVVDKSRRVKLPLRKGCSLGFADVGFHYADATPGVQAIAGFNLEVAQGEKIGLVGFSGSGKTTLTKLLLRFIDVTSGAINIDGIDIRDLSQHDLRSHIAYVPQEPLLFHRSIAENIGYGDPKAGKKEILAAAKAAYVDEFAVELPAGYDTLVGERGVKLSGGQRQRVAIARALLRDAPILVLDEATSALDSESEKLIQEALWKLMKGRTALVIAHRLSTIQHMDRIAVMDKGKIVQLGTHEELLKQKQGIYAKLWARQSGGYFGISPNET